jgi:hypothetical protein
LIRCADLVLAADSQGRTLPWGSTSELRFTLTNEGNDPATSIRLVIQLPVTLVARTPSGGGCVVKRRRIACELPAPLVSSTTFGLVVRPVRTGGGTITITVEARERDGDHSNNRLRLFPRVSACTALGSDRSDVLVGTSRGDVLCGLAGSDRLTGRAGADQLFGGANGDTIVDGPGRDRVSGEQGADVILSDDGHVDSIDCGRGTDRVVADRRDRIARNCERVVRR